MMLETSCQRNCWWVSSNPTFPRSFPIGTAWSRTPNEHVSRIAALSSAANETAQQIWVMMAPSDACADAIELDFRLIVSSCLKSSQDHKNARL
jgi:hypothetical protein